MFIRTFLVGLSLTATMLFSPANACERNSKQAQSCVSGHVWDDDSKTCVPVVSG